VSATRPRQFANILLGNLIQFRQKLDAQDFAEWVLHRQQQRSSFAGPDIDERALAKINFERGQQLVEQCGINWLIRRM